MAFRYVVKKRVFGFDESKSEKYVAASFSIGEISYDRLTRLRRRVWLHAAL